MILAIYPCHRGFAFALVKNKKEIIDLGRASFTNNGTLERMMKRVRRYISFYTPETIVLERYDIQKDSAHGELLLNAIERYSESKGIIIKRYDYEQVKVAFSSYGAKTRYEISKVLASIFPRIAYRLPKERNIWKREQYAQPMFNALALAMTHIYMND